MLNAIIRFALQQRFITAAFSVVLLAVGAWQMTRLPIDVLPNLNRPRVVILTEAHGMAPEEIEALITFPLETAFNGASGVQAVRSTSSAGISVIYVEFDWGTDIYNDRQIVNERLAIVAERLPEGVTPQLAPISSILGQIVIMGVFSEQNDDTFAFELESQLASHLAARRMSPMLRASFVRNGLVLPDDAGVTIDVPGKRWFVGRRQDKLWYAVVTRNQRLEVHTATPPMEMRTQADWTIRQRLLTIPGVSQVFVMGGERKQFQVLVNPDRLIKFGVSLHDVEVALQRSNTNTTGGYLDEQGPNELQVRAVGRLQSIDDIKGIVVKREQGQSILLRQVANVQEGPQVKRGDSAAHVRDDSGKMVGGRAVVLTISKQPDADTRAITKDVGEAMSLMQLRMPKDLRIESSLYQQSDFIDLAIDNVLEALRDGGFLVVIILFLFLLNLRTTFITLTAIPLSIVVTSLVFAASGMSINTMTLGGLAVAIGELVDDAIVDVENIFRRLRENRLAAQPKSPLLVVFQASVEIRNSIVFGTLIVILVFLPLFALSGIELRLFSPLGTAYIVSILCSLFVSLTVTPVLSYWLLSKRNSLVREGDGPLLAVLKRVAGGSIRASLAAPMPTLLLTAAVAVGSVVAFIERDRDFLPPFNEGVLQVNVFLPPGTSLAKSDELAGTVERRLSELSFLRSVARRTGRAELDEHAEGVQTTEMIASVAADAVHDREAMLDEVRGVLDEIPGIASSVEQPLTHSISHMLSGVRAMVAVKIYGTDLDLLRRKAQQVEKAIEDIEGVVDLQVEQQAIIPQLRIKVDGERLQQFGLTRQDINEFVETAMQGRVVSQVLKSKRTFDLLVRIDESFREDLQAIRRLSINLPEGGTTTLDSVATVRRSGGPNKISTENAQRRIVVQCNTSGRGLVDVVGDIKRAVKPIEDTLPSGYFIDYGGQFESQQSASKIIGILSVISIGGMFLVLHGMFRSVNLALQVMIAVPTAFIGGVVALYVSGQTVTIASLVGFISLCGIASRNGILLINHYLHLVRFEGEQWTKEMIIRAGKERLAPVLMTALTSGIGLLPLALGAGEPGKEILCPIATVIVGGLISSTLLEFLVRPALFWKYGVGAARRVLESSNEKIDLVVPKPGSANEIPSPTN